MSPLYRLLSNRYLLRRWDRTVLIAASIALGVATLVSTRILNQTLEAAAFAGSAPLAAGGDLLISNGEPGVPLTLAAELRAANLPGVSTVTPFTFARVTLPGLSDRSAMLLGVELSTSQSTGENPLGVTFIRTLPADLGSAALLLTRPAVVLSEPLHTAWTAARPSPSAPLNIRFGSRLVASQPVGYFTTAPGSPLAAAEGVVGMTITDAARLANPGLPPALAAVVGGLATDSLFPPRVSRIDVRANKGFDLAAMQDALQRVVGTRGLVRPPDLHNRSTQEVVSGVQIGFTLCSLGAMVVGLFLVYNAMAVTVAERRGDIGVLRSLGATRAQVVALFVVAAATVGLVGSLAGVPVGVGLAHAVLYAFRDELGGLTYADVVKTGMPSLDTVVLAVLAGVATAVIASLIPATQAATQDPAEAARRSPKPVGGWWQVAHYATIAMLVGGGLGAILIRHLLPQRVGSFGGMMAVLFGLLLAAPVFVAVLVRFLQPVLRAVLPVEARLATDNLLRAPGRTGVVIGALAAGVAVMVQTAGVGRSNQEPIIRWLDEVIRADRMVFAGSLTDAVGSAAPLEPRVVGELAARPGVQGTFGIRYGGPEFNGTKVFLTALDVSDYLRLTASRLPHGLAAFSTLSLLVGSDGTVVSDNFARRHKVAVGDEVTLPGPRGPVRLRVLATMPDYSWSRGTLFLDRAAYVRLFGDTRLDVVHVFDAGPEAAATVARYAADNGLAVLEREAMRAFVAELIDRVFLLAFLQELVIGLVAGLGVVTALLISVLQRKRELGLLLAVGATPSQVVRAVLWEAVLMGLFGTLLGVLVGLPMEWYILRVVLAEESGFLFDVLIPWRATAGIVAGSLVAATLAGLLPAWRAVRTRIPEAVQYE